VIGDEAWLTGEFIETCKARAAIIEARGLSSAASAANAAIDSMRSVVFRRPPVTGARSPSSQRRVRIPRAAVGFPVRSDGKGGFEIVEASPRRLRQERIRITTEELLGERADLMELLG